MAGFSIGLWMVFVAELGDKTQLVALCLASRFRAGVVLAGILAATLVVHVGSVLLGGGVGRLLPQEWINLAAGLAFVGFGLWTLRGDTLSEEECNAIQGRSPFWLVFTTFFLAELGDKTMLTTVALATKYPLVPVWLGSSLGMVVSDGLAIGVGRLLGKNLPERIIKTGAAIIFFAFGAYGIVQGAIHLPLYAWAIVAVVLGVFIGLFMRSGRKDIVLPVCALQPEPEREEVETGR